MILIISTCGHKLHEEEFIRPITDIIEKAGMEFRVVHFSKMQKQDIEKADKIIMPGSALRDNDSIDQDFSWIKDFDKPMLGICMGFEIIAKAFGGKLVECQEIGPTRIKITNKIPLLEGVDKVYELHDFSVQPPKDFIVCAESQNCVQVIKHKTKEIYGFAFHPEVMNKEIISKFIKL